MTATPFVRHKSPSWYESSARDRARLLLDVGTFKEFLGPEAREMSPHLGIFDLPRWLAELQDREVVGPLRLWSAGALAALLLCLASSFIITPRIQEIRASIAGPIEALAPGHPMRAAHRKAHKFSTQFFVLRLLLAAGLAAGIPFLPGLGARKDPAEGG